MRRKKTNNNKPEHVIYKSFIIVNKNYILVYFNCIFQLYKSKVVFIQGITTNLQKQTFVISKLHYNFSCSVDLHLKQYLKQC